MKGEYNFLAWYTLECYCWSYECVLDGVFNVLCTTEGGYALRFFLAGKNKTKQKMSVGFFP